MLRHPDRREGVKIQRHAAGERRLPDLQHGARIVPARGQLAKRNQRRDVDSLLREIGHEIPDDVALAKLIEHVSGAHEFLRQRGTIARIGLQRGPQLDSVKAEPGARKLSVIGRAIAGGSFIVGAHLLLIAGGLGGAASPVVRPCEHDRIG